MKTELRKKLVNYNFKFLYVGVFVILSFFNGNKTLKSGVCSLSV